MTRENQKRINSELRCNDGRTSSKMIRLFHGMTKGNQATYLIGVALRPDTRRRLRSTAGKSDKKQDQVGKRKSLCSGSSRELEIWRIGRREA